VGSLTKCIAKMGKLLDPADVAALTAFDGSAADAVDARIAEIRAEMDEIRAMAQKVTGADSAPRELVRGAMRYGREGVRQDGRSGDNAVMASARENEDYAGEHAAPMADSGAPAHDVTGGGNFYPDDVYSGMAVQYYGTGNDQLDREAFAIVHALRGKPNAKIRIYRAVPKAPTKAEQIAAVEKEMAQIMRRGGEPGRYDRLHDERERLRALPDDAEQTKPAINRGDWVAITRAYAKDHGESALNGEYQIISREVRAADIFTNGDSIQEWGYDPQDSTPRASTAPDPSILKSVAPRPTDQTDTPDSRRNLREFLRDSKVRAIVYHGTSADFDAFDTARGDLGAHLGTREQANNAAGRTRGGAAPNVMPVHLRITSPLRLKDTGSFHAWAIADQLQRKGIIDAKTAKKFVEDDWRGQKENNAAAREAIEAAGYDGVVYKNGTEGAGDSYIAFRPEQIKSATGNSGAFDPANPSILKSVAPRTPEQNAALTKAGLAPDQRTTLQRLRDKIAEQWQAVRDVANGNVKQRVFDRFHRMSAIEQDLGIGANESAYVSARLAAGLPSIMEGVMLYGAPEWQGGVLGQKAGTVGLLDALKPVEGDIDGWLGWMVGRRAQVLKRQEHENLMSGDDIAALLSLANGKETEFKQAAAAYLKIKSAVLDVAEQAGLINAGSRATWDSVEYIPFYRADDAADTTLGPGTRKALAGQSSGIRQLKGGQQHLADPLGNIVRNFTRLIDASLKNNAMLEAVDQYGDTYFEKVGMSGGFEKIPLSQIKDLLLERGVPQSTIDAMPPGTLAGLQKMWAIKPPADDDVVRVMRDGQPEYYRVPDPELLRTLTSFKVPEKHWAIRPMIFLKRLLTAGVTASPEFMVRNYIRDSGSAWVLSDDKFRLGWDSAAGALRPLVDDSDQRAMMLAGGSFIGGNIHGGSPDETAAALRRALRKKGLTSKQIEDHLATIARTPLQVWDKWQAVGSALENANRNAVYQGRDQGRDGRPRKRPIWRAT
jgi:hypothetical protein